MHAPFTGCVLRTRTLRTILIASLLSAPGCAGLDATHELQAAADTSRRVGGSIGPAEAWALPVEGESPVWDGTAPLGYDDAVAVALQGSPAIRRSLAVIVERRARYVQQGLPPNPTVGFGVGIAIDGLAGAPMMVQGLQMLSWLWKNPHRVAAAEAELRGAVYDAAFECVDVAMRTRVRLAAVLAAQELLEYDRQYVEITQRTMELVQAQVEAGELPELELDRARLEHQEAIEALIASDYAIETSKLELLATMGRPTASTDWIAVGALPPTWTIPSNEQTLLELAAEGRLDVASARETILALQAELGLAETKHFPEIGVGVEYRRNASGRKSIVPGMSITIPVLDNGDPAVAIQSARIDAAMLTLLETLESAQQDVLTGLTRYRDARDRTTVVRRDQLSNAIAAQERSDAAYREGVVDLNTLLMTQRRRIAVERNLVTLELSTMQAMCELRQAVGGSFDRQLDVVEPIEIEARSHDIEQEDAS